MDVQVIIESFPANAADSAVIIAADPTTGEGRSEWRWFNLDNGGLIFGCYPQGDTFFATEGGRSDDWQNRPL